MSRPLLFGKFQADYVYRSSLVGGSQMDLEETIASFMRGTNERNSIAAILKCGYDFEASWLVRINRDYADGTVVVTSSVVWLCDYGHGEEFLTFDSDLQREYVDQLARISGMEGSLIASGEYPELKTSLSLKRRPDDELDLHDLSNFIESSKSNWFLIANAVNNILLHNIVPSWGDYAWSHARFFYSGMQ